MACPEGATKPVSPSASAKTPDGEKKFSLFNIVNPESSLLTFFGSEFSGTESGEHSSAFSDTPIALKPVPERPKPLLELGENNFLGSGAISPGFTVPPAPSGSRI
jgi:hypothetical protein